jgi:hypothetical protein
LAYEALGFMFATGANGRVMLLWFVKRPWRETRGPQRLGARAKPGA